MLSRKSFQKQNTACVPDTSLQTGRETIKIPNWRIAGSYTTGDFEEHMRALQIYCEGAFNSLQKTNPKTWSRAFF